MGLRLNLLYHVFFPWRVNIQFQLCCAEGMVPKKLNGKKEHTPETWRAKTDTIGLGIFLKKTNQHFFDVLSLFGW